MATVMVVLILSVLFRVERHIAGDDEPSPKRTSRIDDDNA